MKKISALLGIILFLGLGYYYFNQKPSNIITYEELEKIKKQNVKPTVENVPLTLKTEQNANTTTVDNEAPVKKVYETKDDKFEAFDRMEREWLSGVKKLLSPKEYLVYEDLRNLNEKEKAEAYKAYHDYLRAKYGNNFKYNISKDQSIREKKINEKYLKDLLKVIGEEKFKKYLSQKDQYNETLRRESKSKSFLVIEF